jgi:hypothetical protein
MDQEYLLELLHNEYCESEQFIYDEMLREELLSEELNYTN